MISLKQIFEIFKTGKTPTELQFKETFSSFFHKSERLPQTQITGLVNDLANKASKKDLTNVVAGLIPMGSVENLAELNTKPKRNNDSYYVNDQKDENGNPYIYRYDEELNQWINTKQVVFKDVARKEDLAQLGRDMTEKYGDYKGSEAFVWAVVDSEDKILFAVRKDGRAFIPGLESDSTKVDKIEGKGLIDGRISESLTFIEDDQYLAAWVDSSDKILFAIQRDGKIFAPGFNFSEYLQDRDMFYVIDDVDHRLQITLDSDNKVIDYLTQEGVRVFNVVRIGHELQFSEKAFNNLVSLLKNQNIGSGTGDWSDKESLALPLPRMCARVDITIAGALPSVRGEKKDVIIEYHDMDGNYFKKNGILSPQGTSSMAYAKKNFTADLIDLSVKFGNFRFFDSFHWKAYYIDVFRGVSVASYRFGEDIYKTKPLGKQKPWSYLNGETSPFNGAGVLNEDFDNGALTHPEGFPFAMYVNNEFHGLFAWLIKKTRDNYNMKKTNPKQIMLDGELSSAFWAGTIDWTMFELRNPSGLLDVAGSAYNGDEPKELSDTDSFSSQVKSSVERLANARAAILANKTKAEFEKYFIVDFFIDYLIHSQVTMNFDGFRKNWIWCTWDSEKWCPTFYDHDSIFGMYWRGTLIYRDTYKVDSTILGTSESTPAGICMNLYAPEIAARYRELRSLGVISVEHIIGRLQEWVESVGYDNYALELERWSETPSYRDAKTNGEYWELWDTNTSTALWNSATAYAVGAKVRYGVENLIYRCKKAHASQEPVLGDYSLTPTQGGFFNSIKRIEEWLKLRITFLDTHFN